MGYRARCRLRQCRRGQIDVAGQTCLEPGREIEPDTSLAYHPSRPRPETAARRLKVLYEDPYILIVDKAAGAIDPAHPRPRARHAPGTSRPIPCAVLAKLPTRSSALSTGSTNRRRASSCWCALPRPCGHFRALFRTHAIERSYLAIVEGSSSPPRGTFDLPLVDDRGDGRRGVASRSRTGRVRRSPITKRSSSSAARPHC